MHNRAALLLTDRPAALRVLADIVALIWMIDFASDNHNPSHAARAAKSCRIAELPIF